MPGQTYQAALRAGVLVPLQWRAGQLPGQTRQTMTTMKQRRELQWRAGQLPGQTVGLDARVERPPRLQWRAGQLPGQTSSSAAIASGHFPASMEGRTIARPNRRSPGSCSSRSPCFNGGPDNCPAKPRTTRTRRPSRSGFNGGPDNCPAKPWGEESFLPWLEASMEGRTIARPNTASPRGCRRRSPRFNGGPDNCPAKPTSRRRGRCSWPCFNGGPDNCPAKRHEQGDTGRVAQLASMEGRTIARPNSPAARVTDLRTFWLQWRAGQLPGQTLVDVGAPRDAIELQWRAGQLPGQTSIPAGMPATVSALQWRAGQLPGQTRRRPRRPPRSRGASMEGRTIARPNPGPPAPEDAAVLASMEGRTIARPNPASAGVEECLLSALQWRAGQLPGQTRRADHHRGRRHRASMEGRTIARPNDVCHVGGWR